MTSRTTDVAPLATTRARQARALTVLVPLKPWGPLYLVVLFNYARWRRNAFFEEVQRLGAVYAMRWTIVQPFSGHRRTGRAVDTRRHLLFETNYVGEWNEYLESFGRILSRGLRKIFWPTVGYPGLGSVEAFAAYAHRHDVEPEHYYAAYGAYSPVEVQQALLVHRLGEDEAVTQPEFLQTAQILPRRQQRRNHPGWLDLIVAVKPGQADALRSKLEQLARPSPFATVERVHFARLVVIDHPSGSYLVFTATYDGGRRYRRRSLPMRARFRSRSLQVLATELVAEAGNDLRPVFEHCAGYPAALGLPDVDAEALAAWLVEHAVMHPFGGSLAYCAYPSTTVHEIGEAIRWTFEHEE